MLYNSETELNMQLMCNIFNQILIRADISLGIIQKYKKQF